MSAAEFDRAKARLQAQEAQSAQLSSLLRTVAAPNQFVTRLAADTDLTVIDNSLVREGLEDVFMRLVDTKERAA